LRRTERSGVREGRDESHPTELDVKTTLPLAVDVIVDGARPVEELAEEIIKVVSLDGE
jgi:hypothetical protein